MSRDLKEKENMINELFQKKDLELQKLAKMEGRSPEETIQLRQRLRDMANEAKRKAALEVGDSVDQLNAGRSINIKDATVSKGLDQTSLPDMAKQKGLGKFGKTLGGLGKKVAGVIPLAGVGMAALSGDPAMAAEELAEDAAGPLALMKPDVAGNPEEEKMMLAERKALENYKKSRAYQDKRREEDDLVEEIQQSRKSPFSKIRKLLE